MSAKILDGRAIAAELKTELKSRVAKLNSTGVIPGLGTILVGDDPASRSYVNGKHSDCEEVGIDSIRIQLPADAGESEIMDAVRRMNNDPQVGGYIVQLPLPNGVSERTILENIAVNKDADGLHPYNLGALVSAADTNFVTPLPCTPAGILELLVRSKNPVDGAHIVVIGRGLTVGRPLGLLLTTRGIDATVTLAHSHTQDLPAICRQADIVVAAVGVPHFVQQSWIKPGATVIDVGVTRIGMTEGGKMRLAGDVDPAVSEVAGFLTPNPGGVGPMTRAMLLANVVRIAERNQERAEQS